MPIPKRKDQENKDSFISRCMSDKVMVSEFSNSKQRYAVCMSKFTQAKKVNKDATAEDFDVLKHKGYFLF